ncbi:MAG TPA: hypothetical protein VMT75_09220 [Candidatus Saccharimonadales bacterium]|nr:hypothetical protein [Candidatus Saccharimonadales bacterium]
MNCAEVQKEMLERLVAREGTISTESNVHRQCCAVCREYYEAQSDLFRSIDHTLGLIANSSVPPSLLPGIRARVGEQAAPRFVNFRGWALTVLVTSALAIIALMSFWNRPRPSLESPGLARQSAPQRSESTPTVAAVTRPPRKPAARLARPRVASAPSVVVEQPTQEVIVLSEEREAFARFASTVSENRAMALALTHPAQPEDESAKEIALLKIESVTVKPLELN